MTELLPRFVSFDGDVISSAQVPVDYTSRAFRFGDSVFESIRVSRLKPLFLEKHISRLILSLAEVKMVPVVPVDEEQIRYMIEKLLKSNRIFGSCRVRLTVFRDGSGSYCPEGRKAHMLIEAFPLESNDYDVNAKPLRVDVYPDMKKPVSRFSAFKSGNSLLFVMAAMWARENGLDDSIILNESGNVCEATSSNIFIYRKGGLITPSLDEGCVAGVMREVVTETAAESGITVYDDTYITIHELPGAEEIFISNAIKGIQPIVAFKNKRYYSKVSRALTEKINQKIKGD
jgi:branched-chain amino acid aminotransferase